MSRLLPLLLGFLFTVTLQAAPETPFACEVIRPTSQADTLQITMSALTEGARRRAVAGNPSPIQIDVMEVYGPVMLHNAGSAETAAAVLQHAIDTTNQALKDSGLGYITLRLRHVRFSQSYDTFPGPAPGQEIKDDRQYYGADLIGFAVGTTPLGIGAAGCRPPPTVPTAAITGCSLLTSSSTRSPMSTKSATTSVPITMRPTRRRATPIRIRSRAPIARPANGAR